MYVLKAELVRLQPPMTFTETGWWVGQKLLQQKQLAFVRVIRLKSPDSLTVC